MEATKLKVGTRYISPVEVIGTISMASTFAGLMNSIILRRILG